MGELLAEETLSEDFANVDGIFGCSQEVDDIIVKYKNPMKTKRPSKM